MAPIAELVLPVVVAIPADLAVFVREDVAGVVGHDVEEDAHAQRVRFVHQLDEIGFRAEARIDVQVVARGVAVVAAAVGVGRAFVFENRAEPHGRAAEVGDVVEMFGDALQLAAAEPAQLIGRAAAGRAFFRIRRFARQVVVEAVDQQEVDDFLAPFALARPIFFAGQRR